MAVPSETPGTRERILETALRLYNDSDPSTVTTAQLAEHAGIAEGNLHYHFRRKHDVVAALFDRYEAVVNEVLQERPEHWPEAFDLHRYQRMWFELIWTFRFLHRGSCQFGRLPSPLRERGWTLQQHIQAHVRQTLASWSQAGYLTLDDDVDALIANVWIVSHYWMDYLAMSRGTAAASHADLGWGIRQMEALCKPYFTPLGQEALKGRPEAKIPVLPES